MIKNPNRSGQRAKRNKRLVMDVYEHVLKPLDAGQVDKYFRADYIQHSPMAKTGAEGLKQFLAWAKGVSPLAEHRVKRVLADDDYVVAHVHVIIQPGDPGNAVVDIFRIQDGLIAEHWDVTQQVPSRMQNDNGMF
ncbi:MAG: nuclear transport factor 2 family protein [Proteobacteria bacterium]|nr:nuclear transport factor 2 family protein [Pseudomonadota bacterium]